MAAYWGHYWKIKEQTGQRGDLVEGLELFIGQSIIEIMNGQS